MAVRAMILRLPTAYQSVDCVRATALMATIGFDEMTSFIFLKM
jgi:hypothetical protein